MRGFLALLVGLVILETVRPAMAKIKEGVQFGELKPTTRRIIDVAEIVFSAHGYDTVITSANDSDHMATSKHYTDDALDFRTRFIPTQEEIAQVALEITERLGPAYDVVVEADHLHVEYDPK